MLAIRGQCQQCQDCTASTGWTSRLVEQKTGLETELQIIASKTRLIRMECKTDAGGVLQIIVLLGPGLH